MIEMLSQTWPWYVAGPLIGLLVPLLLLIGGKQFGISANLRHMCAATFPGQIEFLQYDWKKSGIWNLTFVLGVVIGGFLAATLFPHPEPIIGISEGAMAELRTLGIRDFTGLLPAEIFNLNSLLTLPGFLMIVGGGFLVGFGARYAGGCTSGHAISGLADLQFPSLVAVIGFFIGGLFVTYVLLPVLF